MKSLILHITFIFATIVSLHGQSVNSGAENNTSKNHIVNWTIGQTISSSASTSSYKITQGTIFTTYRIYFENKGKLSINCFPNPCEEYVFLEIKDNTPEKYTWAIISEDGKLLQQEKAHKSLIKIDIRHYNAHLYHLYISNSDGKIVANAKLIKK